MKIRNPKRKIKTPNGGSQQPLVRRVAWPEHKDLVSITISTHVPSKWLFVDRETGDVWKWVEGQHLQRA
jgi:hypothetical protein